jgi:4-alpha-glucanotransferase
MSAPEPRGRGDAAALAEARAALGIDRLVFGIHDASFPGEADEDLGRGSSCARGAERLLAAVRAQGFDGVQLGPQGETSDGNPSPYDSTWFSRDLAGIAAARLCEEAYGALLAPAELRALAGERAPAAPGRARHREARALERRALELAFAAFRARASEPALRALGARLAQVSDRQRPWLDRQFAWVLRREPRDVAERWRFGQLLAHAQHEDLRARSARIGLSLYGDAQIGCAEPDREPHADLFLPDYRMGAPPSRTNPEGQPWEYPVFDPARVDGHGAAFRLLASRMDKLFAEYDALRIDHPHGYVCPWVYRADGADRGAALRAGARLRSSPNLPDHPALARFAIAEAAQLARDPATPRWADDFVAELRPEQVERYGELFEAIAEAARRHGRGAEAIVCEVLSTQPHPLRRVLERLGIGRFRVTQKADPGDPRDVYRVENAAPADWVMVGNHDTPPIWRLVEEWSRDARGDAQARHLAARFEPDAARRARLAELLAGDPGRLAQAKLAELFLGPARQVLVFFSDAFGLRETYNVPGTVDEANWTLRLAPDWDEARRARLARERALDLPLAFALALRARGLAAARPQLVERLCALSTRERGSPSALLPPELGPAGR